MQFVSTRNNKELISFSQAITQCLGSDGGLYVPAYAENLAPWIYYLNETTSFSSLAGALTSALIKEEFSPIISEAIATKAFPYNPAFRQLDNNLYTLDLFTGPSGSHKDFGVSYLAACLEYTLLMQDKYAVVFGISDGEIGTCVAQAMRGKTRLKAVLLYAKGTLRGFDPQDCVWNGGNIYPVEVDGSFEDCSRLAGAVFADTGLVKEYGLTLANTVNIGRLLPQTFFYIYAFSRLKGKVFGDIFYALAPGNYGNLVAGLYGWKFSLPVNGFITECTPAVTVDSFGQCQVLDAVVPLDKRGPTDPGSPSNLERLEEVFFANPAVLKGLVYPSPVSEKEREAACKELFIKYGMFADGETAGAYAAAKKHTDAFQSEDSTIVLVSRDHPSYHAEQIRHWCGEAPTVPDRIQPLLQPVVPERRIPADKAAVVRILEELGRL